MNVSDNPGPRRRRHLRNHDAATTVFRRRTSTKRPYIYEQLTKFVFPLLVCFRIINALCVKTFFQPDEYFQSLEPAWKIAFGSQSGAWITWVGSELMVHNKTALTGYLQEWQYQLRSSLHPVVFAVLYFFSEKVMEILAILPQSRATILIVIPKILQGIFAAIGDYFTWRLAERIYGPDHSYAWTAVCRRARRLKTR
jgi:GPI mannosyltransferase 3